MTTTNMKMVKSLAANPNFTRLCRCCASEDDFMYDIFGGTCSNAQTYCEVVMECAVIQLFRDDGLPPLVCHGCVSILESFVAFRRKCTESESILKQMCSSISPDEQEKFDLDRVKHDDPTLDDIKEEPDDTDETKTELDNTAGENYPESKLYDGIKTEESDAIVPETELDNTVSEKYPDEIKIENEHWPDTNSQFDRSDSEIEKQLFENSVYVKEEFIDDEPEKSNLDCTDETLHPRDRSGRPSKRKPESIVRAGEKPYSCVECDKTFSNKWNLNVHRKTHTGEKPYTCDKCDKPFMYKSSLNQHRKMHRGEKPYSCDDCEKSFGCKSNLNAHRKIHTGERPYSCDTCEKSFARSFNLKKHRIVHTVEKPFVCDVCRKPLTTKLSLDRHRRLHTTRYRLDATRSVKHPT